MGPRTTPPFRADHVGSLLRPPKLLEARERCRRGELSPEELREVEDEAIRAAVAMQERVGLQSATDGEFRRQSWQTDFISRLGGVATAPGEASFPRAFHTDEGEQLVPPQGSIRIDGKVGLEETIFGDDFAALRSLTTTAVPKLTIPSPNMLYFRTGRDAIDRRVYPELDEFWADLVAAYREEVRRLHELGCTYLQIDDVSLAMLNDPELRAELDSRGDHGDRLHLSFIAHLNQVLDAKPAGMTITVHMCRGNFRSAWAARGPYGFVAEAVFDEVRADGFFVEYDDDRSGGFEPLRFVPEGRLVVLGLVTTKRPQLESKDELKRQLEEASAFVPLERLCLSPQCGFASNAVGNELTQEQQQAKLRLVVETAQEVWG
jgi:5-methyltetrahydropteroyltriglutamate--homocysteine methyltransferase